jgi:hypothetical protein
MEIENALDRQTGGSAGRITQSPVNDLWKVIEGKTGSLGTFHSSSKGTFKTGRKNEEYLLASVHQDRH